MPSKVETTVNGHTDTSKSHTISVETHNDGKHDAEAIIPYVGEPNDGTELTLEDLRDMTPNWTNNKKVVVRDVRGSESDFTLDKHGFTYRKHDMPTDVDFNDVESIKKSYFPEMEQWAKETLGISEIKIYDHIVRNEPSKLAMSWKGPARRPHVDTAGDFTYDLITNHFGEEEAKKFTSRRHALINMWRPLKPVERDPLGLCDASSVPEEDQYRFYYRAFPGQTQKPPISLYTKCADSSEHRWYYMHSQTPNDVVLFKIWDSAEDGRAKHVTHASFQVPGTEDIDTRTSVELRSVVCW